MKAAFSSCLTCTKSILPSARFKAPINPLMPSPGNPKMRVTFHSDNRSIKKSLTNCAIKIRFEMLKKNDQKETPGSEDYFEDVRNPLFRAQQTLCLSK